MPPLGDHRRVKAVSPRMRLFLGALLGLAIVGCGPSASAIHPTLPPPDQRPGGTIQPEDSAVRGENPGGADASRTPEPQASQLQWPAFRRARPMRSPA